VQPEERDRYQIADEEVGLDEREGQRREEYREEDVEHALLCVLGADLDDLLRVRDGRLGRALEMNVRLDELDGAVGTGRDGLRRRAREPVNDRAARNQAEEERRMKQREELQILGL